MAGQDTADGGGDQPELAGQMHRAAALPTGATMGQQSFGGGSGSGTNGKTGSVPALQRWLSGRFIKENTAPDLDSTYRYMG